MQQQKILVLGDLMLDEFIWGKVTRISPEAPVPVVHVTKDSAYPGGAANVARNLADFGVTAIVGGIIGQDANGSRLVESLSNSNISTEGLFRIRDFETIVKTRIIALHQQVVRVDREKKYHLNDEQYEQLLKKIDNLLPSVSAVVLEDYGKGFFNQMLADQIIAMCRQKNKIVTVDPNPLNLIDWSGATLVKPNRQEACMAANIPMDDDVDMTSVSKILMKKWNVSYLLITLGEKGMALFHPDEETYTTPTRAKEVYDVSGAGDTVIACFTAALAAGISGNGAAEIANHAAGVVVGKLGTATLQPHELMSSLLYEK